MPKVKQWIHDNKLTLEGFGALIGVSTSYVSLVLNGKRNLSVQLVRTIHEVTGISCQDLIYECTQAVPIVASVHSEKRRNTHRVR